MQPAGHTLEELFLEIITGKNKETEGHQ